ncbi:MAG TPA: DUF4019 domain-containing protein [Pyrinomonadaceae bacterium]|nr:DUF4019 domain-containing protein [Pyrinomonadaceae bacterium]
MLLFTIYYLLFTFSFSCTLKANRGGVPAEARATVETVGEDLAEGRYEKIYNEAAEEWRRASTPEESEATLRKLKERLGNVRTRSVHTATEQDGSGGHLFVITYATQFERADGMETFTLVERDGRWQLARYFVNSDALK